MYLIHLGESEEFAECVCECGEFSVESEDQKLNTIKHGIFSCVKTPSINTQPTQKRRPQREMTLPHINAFKNKIKLTKSDLNELNLSVGLIEAHRVTIQPIGKLKLNLPQYRDSHISGWVFRHCFPRLRRTKFRWTPRTPLGTLRTISLMNCRALGLRR